MLTLAHAEQLISYVHHSTADGKSPVTVAVGDEHGTVLAWARQDDAASIGVAAITAVTGPPRNADGRTQRLRFRVEVTEKTGKQAAVIGLAGTDRTELAEIADRVRDLAHRLYARYISQFAPQ